MKIFIFTTLLCLATSIFSQDSIYFFKEDSLKKMDLYIQSFAKDEESRNKFIELEKYHFNFGKHPSIDEFKKIITERQESAYLHRLTWHFFDEFVDKEISHSYTSFHTLIDFYFLSGQYKQYQLLLEQANSKNEKERKEALRNLLKYKPDKDPLKRIEKGKSENEIKELNKEITFIDTLVFRPRKEKAKDIPLYAFRSHERCLGYLRFSELKNIKLLGGGGYLDELEKLIKSLPPTEENKRWEKGYLSTLKDLDRNLRTLKKMGKGSLMVYMDTN